MGHFYLEFETKRESPLECMRSTRWFRKDVLSGIVLFGVGVQVDSGSAEEMGKWR